LCGSAADSALSGPVRLAVCRLAQCVARYAQEHRTRLVALDLNPVIVTMDGQLTAVDALMQWQDAA